MFHVERKQGWLGTAVGESPAQTPPSRKIQASQPGRRAQTVLRSTRRLADQPDTALA